MNAVRLERHARAMLDELHPEVRDAIVLELSRFSRAAAERVASGPSCPLEHLHAEGYCLAYRFDAGGVMCVHTISVRCGAPSPE